MSAAWDKYNSTLIKLEAVILTDDEEKILREEYEKYRHWFKKWMIEEAKPLSFDDWWRTMADNAKDRAKCES